MKLLESASIGTCRLPHRIIRSATYEGMCDNNGMPLPSYKDLYTELASKGAGGIITGFAYISKDGKAMQQHQAGMDGPDKIEPFLDITESVHKHGAVIFMQLAHAGRQTLQNITGCRILGASSKASPYFREKPTPLTEKETEAAAEQFGRSARRALNAGFDGVQIHAAHGYLIHQFILSSVNTRRDRFGIDPETGIGTAFLGRVIGYIREYCGNEYPVLIKISGTDDLNPPFSREQFINLIHFCSEQQISAIEISCGTMDHALNIFRGDVPYTAILKYNPFYKTRNRFGSFFMRRILLPLALRTVRPFTPAYNLDHAAIAKQHTDIPVISVGGFRSGAEMNEAVTRGRCDFIALCRPFICEPDIVRKISSGPEYVSECSNCNMCAVMCDSGFPTRCYKENSHE